MTRDMRPFLAEPDQRYWRRRANRRVRKARLTRTLLRWSVIVTVNALVCGLLLYAGVRIFNRITTAPEFAVRRIVIDGSERSSVAQTRERLERFKGHNLLDLNLREVARTVRHDPWVLDARPKRILPGTLRITITEREPCALASIGGVTHIVDALGHVIGPAAGQAVPDLPVLTGLDGRSDEALIVGLRRGTALVQRLRASAGGWVAEIAALDLSRRDSIEVRSVGAGPRILLDPTLVERNLGRYLELRQDIRQHVGAVDYVDLRWQDRIAVMPVNSHFQ